MTPGGVPRHPGMTGAIPSPIQDGEKHVIDKLKAAFSPIELSVRDTSGGESRPGAASTS